MVEDSVDDTTSVADRDTLAGTVPTSVHQVSLSTALLHLLNQLLSILCWVELQECLAEASRECRSRLSDATLCTSELCCESREEVVLCLLSAQDRYWRKNSECVCREEDNLLCSRALRVRTLDVLDVVDRIRNTSVLCYALVSEVDLAVLVHSNVLKESVACDGTVDVWLRLLVEVDNLGVAATLEVEHTLVVPSVLVVADELTLRIGRESSLTSTRKTEEDSCVLTVHVGVCRAVHRSDALQWEEVVHHREHTLLHLTAIPCVDDNLLLRSYVEHYSSL